MPEDQDKPVQIFMSYARADDELPQDPPPNAKGFVTRLFNDLRFELKGTGSPAVLWRDTRRIERGDPFDQLITGAIEASAFLLVVLSENWMRSEYCRKELEYFTQRWRHEGELKLRTRIVVVSKHHVDRGRRPSLLQGQEGYDFYVLNDPDEIGGQYDFVKFGMVRDPRYYERIEELGRFLARRVHQVCGRHAGNISTVQHVPPNGRTIYVAIPASDMREPYGTVVTELQRRGYAVVPDPTKNVPLDCSAIEIIDGAFNAAEASVHLLGEGSGGTPEGENAPIVQLQLTRAAAKVMTSQSGPRGFRRFIWAPKKFGKDKPDRDPLEVLRRFQQRLGMGNEGEQEAFAQWIAGDLVHGDIIDEFVSSVVRGLDTPLEESKGDAQAAALASIPLNSQVYVYHWEQDRSYALSVAKALRECKVIPIMPAMDDDPVKCEKLHRSYLMDNDFVVLCWAKATDTWRRTASHELKHWEQLGRTKQFSCRSLVVGPPRDQFKSELEIVPPPPSEIDIVVDLTDKDPPSPQALSSLVPSDR